MRTQGTLALAIVFAAACGGDDGGMIGDDDDGPPLPEVTDPVSLVDPMIGAGGIAYAYGSCFVGAAVPHGIVKLGPDTDGPFGTVSFQHYSGYDAGDDKVQGFSHFHLHGAGASDYGVLSVMPTLAFDPAKTSVVEYEQHFAKSSEHPSAGRYELTLDDGTAVTLTATQRVGVSRFGFPTAGTIVIDLAKALSGGSIDAASLAIDDVAQEITGQLHHVGGMSGGYGYTVYFAAKASVAWTQHWVWSSAGAATHDATAQGASVGGAIDVPAGPAQLAIGVSFVSIDGAKRNLAAEVPTIDTEAVVAAAKAAWAAKLQTALLTGGTEAQRRIFYTSLYHAFLMPSVIDDVDGSYQLAGQPVTTATGYHQMSDLSLWDTYRTVSPLYAWLAPESARDTARSLVGFGDGLGAYPRWPLAIGETGTMLGASAEIAIADAVLRGVPDAGGELAWPKLRAAALDPSTPANERGGRDDIVDYIMHAGYVSTATGRSASVTTEYAHDDFALAQLAGSLGETADHDALLARSHGWRMLYDPSVGFVRGRAPDGTFPATSFDPLQQLDDYAEANAWQSMWMAGIHDPDGIATVMGGADQAVAKLQMFFELAKQDWDTADPSAANFPRPYYWHGNEPDMNAAVLFAQLGRPDLTHEWLRWVLDTMYTDKPDGVAGNDDGGALGSYYVLASMGLYPIAGSDQWVVAAPRFPEVRVIVGGHELSIVADGVSSKAMYVQSVDLDGAPVGSTLTQSQLAAGSVLHFVMTGTAP